MIFPKMNETVTGTITAINDIFATVRIDTYDKDGLMLLSNISRIRIRDVNRHIRVGQQDHFRVIRVDETTGYIDLSMKQNEM